MKNNHITFIFMRMVVEARATTCFSAIPLVRTGTPVQKHVMKSYPDLPLLVYTLISRVFFFFFEIMYRTCGPCAQ